MTLPDTLTTGRRLGGMTSQVGRTKPYDRPSRRGMDGRFGNKKNDADMDSQWQHDRFSKDDGGKGTGLRQDASYSGSRHLDSRKHTVLVSNLHWGVSVQDLEELFGMDQGQLLSAKIKYDTSGRSEGIATLVFTSSEAAQSAVDEYHKRELDGLPLQLELTDSGKSFSGRLGSGEMGRGEKGNTDIIDRLGKPSVFQRLGKSLDDRLGQKGSSTLATKGLKSKQDARYDRRPNRAEGDWRADKIDLDTQKTDGYRQSGQKKRHGAFYHADTEMSMTDVDMDTDVTEAALGTGSRKNRHGHASRNRGAITPPTRRPIVSYVDADHPAADGNMLSNM
ncbi:hypothetical protein BDV3_004125 [Batrachochytrium dendrobatidis]|uniref:RRM domain-containing protein n=1 Tax=Batrachochytrium dendrobatidis (strain JEL423) TaxID=403673 RepID=A0A177WF46_BATDL|nr:hypothetical protein BDEG_22562 [Batrachochytrium dendrobatidis JEL423]